MPNSRYPLRAFHLAINFLFPNSGPRFRKYNSQKQTKCFPLRKRVGAEVALAPHRLEVTLKKNFVLYLMLIMPTLSRASEITTQIPAFNTDITLRSSFGDLVQLLDIGTTGQFQPVVTTTQRACDNSPNPDLKIKTFIGVYPLADQLISSTLRNANLGSGSWPKPSNMPTLKSWDIVVNLDPSSITTADGVTEQDAHDQIVSAYEQKKINARE